MGATLGVSFVIGAKLASSVASAFASVQNKLKATQQAMRVASNNSKTFGGIIDSRKRLDFALDQARRKMAAGTSLTAAEREELRKLNLAYRQAAKSAGVYGESLNSLIYKQQAANAEKARAQRSLNALNTVQRGRNIRSGESQQRKNLISNAMADLAPAYAMIKPLKIGMEFDASMSKVAAISGATGEAFEALRKQARELGASTVWSAKEAAEGMSFLAMAGFRTNEVMAAMPGMLSLASAGGMDLASTADIASNILTGFKFEASQMNSVGNILAKTFTSSNTSIASLGESFKYCAPVAANAGQAFESVAAMIGKLGDAGIQGSMAGTGLNAIIGRMAKPPKEAAAAMAQLGVKVADSAGKMRPMEDVFAEIQRKMGKYSEEQQIALAKALYGAEHFAKGFVLQIASADGSLNSLRDSLKNVDGYADKVAKIQNDNLAGDFRQFNSAMQEVAICITDVVTPPLRQLMSHVTPIVQGFGKWIEANPRLAQGLTLLGGGFMALKTAGLGLALLNSYRRTFVGGLISMQGQAMRPIAAVRNGFSLMRMELTRPVPGATFGGAARQGLASLKTRLESLRSSVRQTAASLASIRPASIAAGIAAGASGAAAATGRAGWNSLRLGIRGVGMAFKTMFGPMSLLMMGMGFAVDYIIERWDKIAPYFQALWDNVKAIFTSVKGWLAPIFEGISSLFDPFMEKIKSFGGFIGGMLEKLGTAWDWLTGNDTEKKKRGQAQALHEQRRQEQEVLIAKMPKALQEQARAEWQAANPAPENSAWAPEKGAMRPPKEAAIAPPKAAAAPTVAQLGEETAQLPNNPPQPRKKDTLKTKEAAVAPPKAAAVPTLYQVQEAKKAMAAEKPARHESGLAVENQGKRKTVSKAAAPPEKEIIQPQVQVAVNVTQNGIPEQSFANGVMTAIKNRQSELEAIISGIVNEQARLAYG